MFRLPEIGNAVAITPDERRGEIPVAVVVPRAGQQIDSAEPIEHCRERIAAYKIPRAVHKAGRVGEDLGASDWLTVDQDLIDRFADVTGDHRWVHSDPERAAREMPGERTIAHGLLTFSLTPS